MQKSEALHSGVAGDSCKAKSFSCWYAVSDSLLGSAAWLECKMQAFSCFRLRPDAGPGKVDSAGAADAAAFQSMGVRRSLSTHCQSFRALQDVALRKT